MQGQEGRYENSACKQKMVSTLLPMLYVWLHLGLGRAILMLRAKCSAQNLYMIVFQCTKEDRMLSSLDVIKMYWTHVIVM